jgi:hypothetical protein
LSFEELIAYAILPKDKIQSYKMGFRPALVSRDLHPKFNREQPCPSMRNAAIVRLISHVNVKMQKKASLVSGALYAQVLWTTVSVAHLKGLTTSI